MMESNKIKQVIHGRTNVHIGKNGITPAVIDEVRSQVKIRKVIKVKFLDLSGYDSMVSAAHKLADLTQSRLIETRGHTCILGKSVIR